MNNIQHKKRSLALKQTTYELNVPLVFVLSCNDNLLYKVQGSVLLIKREHVLLCPYECIFFLFTSVGIELCWLEAWPVTVISHTDRCGQLATLRNLAQM